MQTWINKIMWTTIILDSIIEKMKVKMKMTN